jgi:hypothetical protein
MDIAALRSRASEVQHGFTSLVAMADEIEAGGDALDVADELWAAPEHQARMVAVMIWGDLAAGHPELLLRLRDEVSEDDDWRVQEILARALTAWCTATGWEAAVPTLESWLGDRRPHVRRAATEGPRVWTSRDYFRAHPEIAVAMLRAQLDDPDDYARRSAENALRDVLKRYPRLVP